MMATAENPKVEDFYVDPFPGRKGSERIVDACGKCGGDGIYHAPSGLTFYTATVGSVNKGCFGCMGTGKVSYLVSSARGAARREAKRKVAELLRVAAFAAERETFEADHADELAMAKEWADRVPAAREALETYMGLGASPEAKRELGNVAGAVERWQEREAAKRPVPVTDQRIEVCGEVVSTRWQEGLYPGSGSMKMLLVCDGYKLWGSVPSVEGYGVDVGAKLKFMARVEPSKDDPSFGFFKRPTKAEFVEDGEQAE